MSRIRMSLLNFYRSYWHSAGLRFDDKTTSRALDSGSVISESEWQVLLGASADVDVRVFELFFENQIDIISAGVSQQSNDRIQDVKTNFSFLVVWSSRDCSVCDHVHLYTNDLSIKGSHN